MAHNLLCCGRPGGVRAQRAAGAWASYRHQAAIKPSRWSECTCLIPMSLRDGSRKMEHILCYNGVGPTRWASISCQSPSVAPPRIQSRCKYIRQYIRRKPSINRQEARAVVEAIGFAPIAMEHIVPPIPNPMFLDKVRFPPEDGMPVITARAAVDVDALSNGPAPLVLSHKPVELDLRDYD